MNDKLRAVAVCRCSTEEVSQKDALINQVKESKACIKEHGWILVDTYVEAKSGTTTKGRQEYNRLFNDLGTDKFDIVVIKSQDRLMRNVKDWYMFVDKMLKNHKRLFMYLENKFYSPDDALITGIKAILAEEYSRDLSRKINNAHRHRQSEGHTLSITNATYGYTKLKDKRVVIDEDERPMIEKIFKYAAMGYGSTIISQLLYKEGFRNRKGDAINPLVIRKIIGNPLYMGTAILNKTHFDFDSKQTIKNPESEWIIHKNAVPAIISEELFNAANKGIQVRAKKAVAQQSDSADKFYGLEGILICGLCGKKFYRSVRSLANGKRIAEWKCSTFLKYGRNSTESRRKLGVQVVPGCDNVHLNEQKLYVLLDSLCGDKSNIIDNEDLMKTTLQILNKALLETNTDSVEKLKVEIDKLAGRKNLLLDKLLDGIITNEEYREKAADIERKLNVLNEHIDAKQEKDKQAQIIKNRMQEIEKALKDGIIDKVKSDSVLGSIKEIRVFPKKLEIYFSSLKAVGFSCNEGISDVKVITIEHDCTTSSRPSIEREKQEILEYLKTTPDITIKELAVIRGEPVSRLWRRINELKAEKKVKYSTPNGKGHWIVEE